MPLWVSNDQKMDGLLAVLRLKWVAWAMYLHPYYIVSNPGIPSSTSRKLRNECSRIVHRCSYVLLTKGERENKV